MPTKTKQSTNGKSTYKPPDEVRIVINQAQESGTSGLKTYAGYVQEAYNSSLYWPQCAPLYSRLRSNPTMTMIWRAFQAWGRQIEPVIDLPDKPSDDDKKYKDFLLSDFENMEGGFGKYMDIASYRPVMDGFFVWDVQPALRKENWVPPVPQGQDEDEWRSQEDDGLIGIRRIAARDNNSFLRWEFNTRKKAIGMWQQDFPSPSVMIPLDRNHGLHHTIGNPNNPEGTAGLEPVWRLERIQYGLQVIQGIGFEHAAGHLSVTKTESGTLSDNDIAMVAEAAKNLLSAQEGNYGYWPYGIEGQIVDTNFQAASTILEAIKYYDILMLAVFMMQTIALNTLTNTGALASQVDTSDMAVFTFNSMIDGLAAQYDEQIGKRLYLWNKESFPGLTKRPKIKFSHVERNIALASLGSFLQQLNGILPLDEEDYIAIRKKSGFLPENNPIMDGEQIDRARTMDANRDPNQPQPQEGRIFPSVPIRSAIEEKLSAIQSQVQELSTARPQSAPVPNITITPHIHLALPGQNYSFTSTMPPAQTNINVDMPEQAAPVVNVENKVDLPEQPAPMVHVENKVDIPEQAAPVVNVENNVDIPAQAAPVVELHTAIENHIPEQPAPVVNVENKVDFPELPAPVVNIENKVEIPEQAAPIVNIENKQAPIELQTSVNVPEQPAPSVTVNVQPTPIENNVQVNPTPIENNIEVNAPKLKSSTDTVERDEEGNIKGKTTDYEYEDGEE